MEHQRRSYGWLSIVMHACGGREDLSDLIIVIFISDMIFFLLLLLAFLKLGIVRKVKVCNLFGWLD